VSADTNISLTPAEISMVRQSLRAEEERMIRQGYGALAKLAAQTRDKIADEVIDNARSMV
jgi:hypothetical protein